MASSPLPRNITGMSAAVVMKSKRMASKYPCDQDPDYDEIPERLREKRRKIFEKDRRKQTEAMIEAICKDQIASELLNKDNEIDKLVDTLQGCEDMLDRLRGLTVTRFYSLQSSASPDEKNVPRSRDKLSNIHHAVKEYLGKAPEFNSAAAASSFNNLKPEVKISNSNINDCTSHQSPQAAVPQAPRVRMKFQIVIGNVSKFIPPSHRAENEQFTHIWKVYAREAKGYSKLSTYVKKVCFLLHPSFRPNDVIEVNNPPFEVTRRGWGDFPIRVQIFFLDPCNKPVDIIHYLKLDKTYTGLTTQGAETHAEIQLLSSKQFANAPVISHSSENRDLCISINSTASNNGNEVQASECISICQKDRTSCQEAINSESKVDSGNKKKEVKHDFSKQSLSNSVMPIISTTATNSSLGQVLNGFTPFLKCTDSQGRMLLLPRSSLVQLVPSAAEASVTQSACVTNILKSSEMKHVPKSNVPLRMVKVLSSQQNKPAQVLLLSKSRETKGNLCDIVPINVKNYGFSILKKNGVTIPGPSVTSDVNEKAVVHRPNLSDWQQALNNLNLRFYGSADFGTLLKRVIKFFPLVQEHADRSILPFCASSTNEYLSYNIGKLRAAEWLRAGMVRTAILAIRPDISSLKPDMFSRKRIIIWCRQHGYTPQVHAENINPSVLQTTPESISTAHSECLQPTLSDAENLLETIKGRPHVQNDDDLNIDVLHSENSIETASSLHHRCLSTSSAAIDSVHFSCNESLFVKETLSQISVPVKHVELEPGVLVPAVEEMILACCKEFAEDILRSSIQQGYKRMGGKVCAEQVILSDVCLAVKEEPSFEFLTNKYLGVSQEHRVNS